MPPLLMLLNPSHDPHPVRIPLHSESHAGFRVSRSHLFFCLNICHYEAAFRFLSCLHPADILLFDLAFQCLLGYNSFFSTADSCQTVRYAEAHLPVLRFHFLRVPLVLYSHLPRFDSVYQVLSFPFPKCCHPRLCRTVPAALHIPGDVL